MIEGSKVEGRVNDLDLFDVFEILWKEKLSVLISVCLAIGLGGGYLLSSEPRYEVKVEYTINSYLPKNDEVSNRDDVEAGELDEVTKGLLAVLSDEWVKSDLENALTLEEVSPKSTGEYQELFREASKVISKRTLEQAYWDVDIIAHELPSILQSTEVIAKKMLDAKRTIKALLDGGPAVEFDVPVITKVEPHVFLILSLSAFLGGVSGAFFVLVRMLYRIRNRS